MKEMFEILKELDKWYDEGIIELKDYYKIKHDIVSCYQRSWEEGEIKC